MEDRSKRGLERTKLYYVHTAILPEDCKWMYYKHALTKEIKKKLKSILLLCHARLMAMRPCSYKYTSFG